MAKQAKQKLLEEQITKIVTAFKDGKLNNIAVSWTWQKDARVYWNVSVYLSLYLSLYLSMYPSVYSSIYLSVHVYQENVNEQLRKISSQCQEQQTMLAEQKEQLREQGAMLQELKTQLKTQGEEQGAMLRILLKHFCDGNSGANVYMEQ
jgi:hypothetical protein